jgi:hypothetical protein
MSQFFIEKRRNSPELGKLSICIWLAVIPVFMPGCGLGPSMMRANHLTYNDAVQFTERRELLLNIVRLRYNDGPEFLATNSISTQFSIDLSAAAGGQVGEDQALRTNLFNLGGTAGYSERPTITFTPRNEKEFTQQLISPIDLEIIFLLVNYGWDIDRVLRLTCEGINGLRNETIREAPLENYEIYLREFARTAKDLGRLQQLGLVEISFEPEELALSGPISAEKVTLNEILNANKDDYRLTYQEGTNTYHLKKVNRNLVLRFSRNAFQHPELRQIVKRLNLVPDVQTYRIVNAPGSQIQASEISKELKDLILSTRSVLGTMAYLAQGVSVPEPHSETGVASSDSRDRSAGGIISDLLQVKVQKEKPNHVSLAVPYKGYWFYVEENDISSKRTIGVLNSLVRLKIKAAGAQNVPILTLPVGR